MKFFAAFAAILAVAVATPSEWNLHKLSEAIENPTTDPAFIPTLEQALNIHILNVFQGNEAPIRIATQPGVAGTFTLQQLDFALQSQTYGSPVFEPYLETALNEMMNALISGQAMETVDILLPAFELSYWSLQELDEALSSSATNAALVPYLEKALNSIMSDLMNGGHHSAAVVIAPADIVAPEPIVVPSPIIVEPSPVEPSPIVVAPVAPEQPAAPTTPVSSSPLVQIIVNVQQSNAVGVVSPSPVIDRPQGEAVVAPTPIIDRPQPEADATPIIARPEPEASDVSPIDIIAPVLPIEALPAAPIIDRPQPEASNASPIDIIAPVLPIEALPPTPEAIVGPLV